MMKNYIIPKCRVCEFDLNDSILLINASQVGEPSSTPANFNLNTGDSTESGSGVDLAKSQSVWDNEW